MVAEGEVEEEDGVCSRATARVLLGLEAEDLEGLEEEAEGEGGGEYPLAAVLEKARAKHGGDGGGGGILAWRVRAEAALEEHAARRRTLRGLARLRGAEGDDEEVEEEEDGEDEEQRARALLESGELPALLGRVGGDGEEEDDDDDEGALLFRRLELLQAMGSSGQYAPSGARLPGKGRLVWRGEEEEGDSAVTRALAARRLAGGMVRRFLQGCRARRAALEGAMARVRAARAAGGVICELLVEGEEVEVEGEDQAEAAAAEAGQGRWTTRARAGHHGDEGAASGERVLCISRPSSAAPPACGSPHPPAAYKTVDLRDRGGGLAALLAKARRRHGRGPFRPLVLYLHDADEEAAQAVSPAQQQPQCTDAAPAVVRDGRAELLLVPEIDLQGLPPPVAALLTAAVAALARHEHRKRARGTRTEGGVTARKAKAQARREKEAEEGGRVLWAGGLPNAHALPPDRLLPGPVCAAVRAACQPSAAALARARARGGGAGSSHDDSSGWMPGLLRVSGAPLLVAVDPALVRDLLALLPPEALGPALRLELQGAEPFLHGGGREAAVKTDDPEGEEREQNGDGAAAAAAAAVTDKPAALLADLARALGGGEGEPRARSLNQQLAAVWPPRLAVGDDGRPALAANWLYYPAAAASSSSSEGARAAAAPLSRRRLAKLRAGLGCVQEACSNGPVCAACYCCLPRHCGCGLAPGAPPHRAAGSVAWERARHEGWVQTRGNRVCAWSREDAAAMDRPPPLSSTLASSVASLRPSDKEQESGSSGGGLQALARGDIARLVALAAAQEEEEEDGPSGPLVSLDVVNHVKARVYETLTASPPQPTMARHGESGHIACSMWLRQAVDALVRRAKDRSRLSSQAGASAVSSAAGAAVWRGVRALDDDYEDVIDTLKEQLADVASEEGPEADRVKKMAVGAVFGECLEAEELEL